MDIQQVLTAYLNRIDKTAPASLLKTGQIIDAKVVETQKNQDVTLIKIQLNERILSLIAEKPVHIDKNQTLRLQVIAQQPVLTFKQVPPATRDNTKSRHPIPTPNNTNVATVEFKQVHSEKSISTLIQALNAEKTPQRSSSIALRFQIDQITAKTLTGKLLPVQANAAEIPKNNDTVTLEFNQIEGLKKQAVKSGQQILLTFDPKRPKLLQYLETPKATTQTDTQRIQHSIREYLPKQQSAPVLLQELSHQIKHIEQQKSVPEQLKHIARRILLLLPKPTQLSNPAILKQQLRDSGIYLESKVFNPSPTIQPAIENDFKLKLLQLSEQITRHLEVDKAQPLTEQDRDLFRQLQQKSSQVLARIVMDQINSLPKEEGNKQVWLLELPFLNQGKPDKVRLEIEQQAEQDKTSEDMQKWAVNITVSPPGLGTVYCRMNCVGQVVNTRFWSDRPATADKISRFLDRLKQQLNAKGVTTGIMTVQAGKPEHVDSGRQPHQLINEKA
ncbi:flagellar hook-length control protein FliK [methane-oxidizing endosymbiont of Gigantopelta aegis]|uniref:flagellar hook-length control protein FliK n=1 Tax=methane-oxidizing endosymbiont of Gigantopelta aegis TaxID=2794938 RepID=UPI0018DE1F84|nr:flagellar hook-length control protein FliK [methane-oxidizing endosymbiont of Gigantopelta aegis]